MLSDKDYAERRSKLLTESNDLMARINQTDTQVNNWREQCEKTFDFCKYARYWFKNGDAKTKVLIASTIRSILTLMNRSVSVEQRKPFYLIEKSSTEFGKAVEKLEPEKMLVAATKSNGTEGESFSWLRTVDRVRTYFKELDSLVDIQIPVFAEIAL